MFTPVEVDIITVLNPNFNDNSIWIWAHPWSWAPNKAVNNQTLGVHNPLKQGNLPFIVGNTYDVTFDLLNPAFINPNAGIIVEVAGDTADPIAAAGTHTVRLTAKADTETLSFITDNWAIGDYCEIDNVSVVGLGDNITEIKQIQMAPEILHEVQLAVAADLWATYLSDSKNSRILILFDA